MPVPVCTASVRALTQQTVPSSCLHTEPACSAQYRGSELGSGKFYVGETEIVWIRDGDEVGFKLNYKQLIAHAVSKDTNVYPRTCVYMLYEGGTTETLSTDSSDEEESGNVEIRIAPQNDNAVQRIYQAISDGQLLHPDDEDESDSEEGDQEFNPGGLAMSTQIRFDSDGQLLVNPDNEQIMPDDEEDSRRFEDMEED
ncbi:hypothetical protein ACHWQZ_G013711 [Mnemiopsis leidyi]